MSRHLHSGWVQGTSPHPLRTGQVEFLFRDLAVLYKPAGVDRVAPFVALQISYCPGPADGQLPVFLGKQPATPAALPIEVA